VQVAPQQAQRLAALLRAATSKTSLAAVPVTQTTRVAALSVFTVWRIHPHQLPARLVRVQAVQV
jgi:hypothetical protein